MLLKYLPFIANIIHYAIKINNDSYIRSGKNKSIIFPKFGGEKFIPKETCDKRLPQFFCSLKVKRNFISKVVDFLHFQTLPRVNKEINLIQNGPSSLSANNFHLKMVLGSICMWAFVWHLPKVLSNTYLI